MNSGLGPRDIYIQPIRPVVTMASVARKHSSQAHNTSISATAVTNRHISLSLTATTAVVGSPPLTCSSLHSVNSNDHLNISQSHNLKNKTNTESDRKGVENEMNVQQDNMQESGGLVLSLSGNIGSVSGRGVQTVWGREQGNLISKKKESPASVTSGHDSASSFAEPVNDVSSQRPQKGSRSETEVRSEASIEVLPSYDEAVMMMTVPNKFQVSGSNSQHLEKSTEQCHQVSMSPKLSEPRDNSFVRDGYLKAMLTAPLFSKSSCPNSNNKCYKLSSEKLKKKIDSKDNCDNSFIQHRNEKCIVLENCADSSQPPSQSKLAVMGNTTLSDNCCEPVSHINQDDLQATLEVLKHIDSQYFQHSEDSNSSQM